MRRRTRLLAGTFALVAMTFALTETVLASMCASVMGMQHGEVESVHLGPHHSGHHAMGSADHDTGPASHPQSAEGQNERHCPFGPAAAAQGCTGVASLPTHAMDRIPASLAGALDVFVETTEQDLLLTDALFHPPRA